MIEITNFTVTKNHKKETEAQPDRTLSTNLGDKENPNWVYIANGWVKTNTKNEQYLSVQMTKPYQDKTGYVIVSTVELEALKKENETLRMKLNSPMGNDYPIPTKEMEDAHSNVIRDEDGNVVDFGNEF